MPKVTIWIRKDDEARWRSIKNKPQWITTALNTSLIDMAVNQVEHSNFLDKKKSTHK